MVLFLASDFDTATTIAAMLGGFVALLAGFYAFANKQMKDAREERQEERKEFTVVLDKLSKATVDVAQSNREIAQEVAKGNVEAKERNGHLAELVIQGSESVKVIADTATDHILSAVQNVQQQNIEHQHVVNEVVEGKS